MAIVTCRENVPDTTGERRHAEDRVQLVDEDECTQDEETKGKEPHGILNGDGEPPPKQASKLSASPSASSKYWRFCLFGQRIG